MSNNTANQEYGFCRRPRTVRGRFYPQGTAAPTFNTDECQGVDTIVRNSAGNWTITLKEAFIRLASAKPGLQLHAATDLNVQFGDFSNLGTSTPFAAIIRAVAAGVETDIAADANNSVEFEFTFDDSGGY